MIDAFEYMNIKLKITSLLWLEIRILIMYFKGFPPSTPYLVWVFKNLLNISMIPHHPCDNKKKIDFENVHFPCLNKKILKFQKAISKYIDYFMFINLF